MYLSLVGLVGAIGLELRHRGKEVFSLLHRRGFIVLSIGLIISSSLAYERSEAFLQLTNFLPFFLFFAIAVTLLQSFENPRQELEKLAWCLVVATLPINLAAPIEYWLKTPSLVSQFASQPWLAWLYDEQYYGHRAQSVFDHPNVMASYLVLIFGLGLGLILKASYPTEPNETLQRRVGWITNLRRKTWLLYSATFLNLVGIFCSGSRNGIIIALSQLLIFGCFAHKHQFVKLAGLGGAGAIAISTFFMGIGGRQLSLSLVTDDPRFGVWNIAYDLIQQRPLLGWGLGNYKLLYQPQSVPGYDYIPHAHNFWLMLAVETGAPIMIAFVVIIGFICYQGVRTFQLSSQPITHRAILLSYLLAFWGCVVFALFDTPFYDARVNILDWFALAGIYVLSQPERDKPL
ncbi:MAG: O-antigen ligase family protein [Leptolyngbyaceae cyanobacterium MO_188.B28]|nr:O-antigen ligase family protein [Leptolyngbyaceae cyanobacterium MO_188.B28]